MTLIALDSLPLGFRFQPTDEELVNYYLKPKITGRIRSQGEVIPEIDVCKCEPWDLPDKSLIKSDDPEWFFFAPKDRKYPNGHRSNRATEAGYWKATGKDRIIRSKSSAAKSTIIGMKKTLVFHRGRAPKGVRTHWIMHEYRTTEPEFESGDQGGYVIYRLFRKPEERISTSKADEMETSGFSPTPIKSSPGDTQHEADVMDDAETLLNDSPKSDLKEEPKSLSDSVHKRPAGIKRQMADKVDCSTNVSVKPGRSYWKLDSPDEEIKVGEKADPLQDALAKFLDPGNEQIYCDVFPDISSTELPYTDYTFMGNENQEFQIGSLPVDNGDEDLLNEFLISALNPDGLPSGASIFPKDSVAGNLPKPSLWDSASCKDSGTSSDIETEPGLLQGAAALEASEWFCGSSLLPTDSSLLPTQLSTLYENATLLPYDISGTDMYSIDSGADSLQDLFSGMGELSNQKTISDSKDDSEGTGIEIVRHQSSVWPNSDNFFVQGTAARRIRLQSSILKVPFAEPLSRKSDEDEASTTKAKGDILGSMEEATSKKNTMRNRDDPVETGLKIQDQQSPNELFTQQGETSTNVTQCYELQMQSVSDHEPSISSNHGIRAGRTEVEEHVDDNISGGESTAPALPNKLDQSSILDTDEKPSASSEYQMPDSMLRLRTKSTSDSENMHKHSPSCPKASRGHSVIAYMMYLLLSVVFLLLCFGIRRHMSPLSVHL
ncbi:hypothetical protein OPV22_012131 [Ensete ventricosum]|uniref:NAC domain-containing protein n=1 Tax=Ensete ventricosum TaxID=4639 RepID=A0AAV8QWE3_ENSVE|nr:hypothetical protein OPV22_012131 [Ensete ventricosum]